MENHRITPAARRVERQVLSDFYRLKTLYVPSIAQVGCAMSRFSDPGRSEGSFLGPNLETLSLCNFSIGCNYMNVSFCFWLGHNIGT